MKITIFPPEYIINAARNVHTGRESDFFLRVIHIKNTTKEVITLKKIQFECRIGCFPVKQIIYPEKVLDVRANQFAAQFTQFTGEIAQVLLGRKKFWDIKDLSTTKVLTPNQETGLLFEHFRIVDKNVVDECVVSVYYLQNKKERIKSVTIPVVEYKNKNEYIFPLKGAWLVCSNYNNVYEHRRVHFEEFAMDMIQLTDYTFILHPDSDNEDIACYGKNVYCIADGEIVDCCNEIPDNPKAFNSRLQKDQWDALITQYGWVAGMAGNYVTIKHKNEYSFYAHLIPGSVMVEPGDVVTQGQVVGRLGNSGNSDSPHLHFHVMDGPSILSARGLPCTFTNIKTIYNELIPFINEDNSFIHTV